METKEKMKLAFTYFATAISIFFAAALARYIQSRRRHRKASSSFSSLSSPQCYLHTSKPPKPQDSFKRVFADNSYAPFKHFAPNDLQEKSSNLHPYIKEITSLMQNPNQILSFNFVNGEEEQVDFEMKGPHVWVDTEDQLLHLVDVLSKESVFAVDTEQHSLHSFLGFTCLIQISTHNNQDYLVDTIALHDVMPFLRPVFADPNICKVFHGADSDILWLQRDFHIYVVNLFDTAKACDVLSKQHKSLAYLLETYCGITTNKLLQREDWRLRPLSGEMVGYARKDAHYLLYIANCLVTELKKQHSVNLDCLDEKFPSVIKASRRSNMICLQLYKKEIEASPGDSAASAILSRYLNGKSVVPLKYATKVLVGRLCMWRDLMARVHDESLRYVLSDQAIVALASRVPTTTSEAYDAISKADLDSCSLGIDSSIPCLSAVVYSHLEDLHNFLWEKISYQDDIFERILQKHLGPNGSCPLSVHNYTLLFKSNLKLTNGFLTQQNVSETAKQVSRKASTLKHTSKSPVYQNFKIYDIDGRLLGYGSRYLMKGYLRRGVAKPVNNDPSAVMLLSKPKESFDNFIKNMCVGCGETNHYLRFRVIPPCYREHLPENLTVRHDVILLCVDCNGRAHSAAEKHKRQIAEQFGIPLYVKKPSDSSQTKSKAGISASVENLEEAAASHKKVRDAAYILLLRGPNLPIKRREELTEIVMKFFGGDKVSEEDLHERILLQVDLSPYHKLKLERKRGLLVKHSSEVVMKKDNENNAVGMEASALAETLESDIVSDFQMGDDAKEGQSISLEMETGRRDSKLEVTDKPCVTDSGDLKLPRMRKSKWGKFLGTNRKQGNSRKLSLSGQRPHGKQVVEHLLKEYGEEGVRQFCQGWRQVFVEAVHPRFLPDGWDVISGGSRILYEGEHN